MFDDARSHTATQQFWNSRQVESFENITRRSGRIQAITRMAEIAGPALCQQGSVTIDLGCGTGTFAETIGLKTIIGVDFSRPLLTLARQRMHYVVQQSVFDLGIAACAVNHVVSLFVIDDYPTEKKREFAQQVFTIMKPGGTLFFAAYSPNDERMGICKEVINTQTDMRFTVYLESASWYETLFSTCGFVLERTEVLKTPGLYDGKASSIPVKREFMLMAATKP